MREREREENKRRERTHIEQIRPKLKNTSAREKGKKVVLRRGINQIS